MNNVVVYWGKGHFLSFLRRSHVDFHSSPYVSYCPPHMTYIISGKQGLSLPAHAVGAALLWTK